MAIVETYEERLARWEQYQKRWANAISNRSNVQKSLPPKKKPKPRACLALPMPRAKSNLIVKGVQNTFKPIRIIKQPSPTH